MLPAIPLEDYLLHNKQLSYSKTSYLITFDVIPTEIKLLHTLSLNRVLILAVKFKYFLIIGFCSNYLGNKIPYVG